MNLKKLVKFVITNIFSLIPLKKQNRIFSTITSKSNLTGPNRFLFNLESHISKDGWEIERLFLSKCKSALILSNAPSDDFHKVCKNKGIKTVLRVDGFYYPMILSDNKVKDNQDILNKLDITQRMQRDLVLSNHVIYQSKFSKQMADRYLYKREKDFSIIYNGVNTDHFKPIEDIEREKNFTIMVLGSLRDIDLLIFNLEVFKKFNIQVKSNLNIVGTMTSDVKRSYDNWLDKNKKIKNSIKVFETVSYEDLPQVINKADVSLHLKAGDWCPNAVLETMACGIPVICQRYGGTSELVNDDSLIINFDKPFIYDNELQSYTCDKLNIVHKNSSEFKKKAFLFSQNFVINKMAVKYLNILETNEI